MLTRKRMAILLAGSAALCIVWVRLHSHEYRGLPYDMICGGAMFCSAWQHQAMVEAIAVFLGTAGAWIYIGKNGKVR
jgi:hypothetical protein